ncbi:kynurenine formamidase-like [Sitophilus oryzae]|uniref:Kynurenine formamidase-like n=1 Tax=Sitophilus oryzae TaxID=7048 RepID=A0A6J2Y5E8_SITOR|nr:kynurenine formamidase-like [Sitophilus oryzae]
MTQEPSEIDKLYYPHWWQKRYAPEEALEKFINYLNTATRTLRNQVRTEFNIPYGFRNREKYNILGIDLPDDSPIIIYVHGGYWQAKEITHTNQGFISKIFHKHGIKVITLGYELCPDVEIKDIIIEIETALRRCLDYAKLNMSKGVHLVGHSVGAHLVACMFNNFIPNLSYDDQSLIKSVFLLCGIYDLSPLPQTEINKPLNLTDKESKAVSPQFMTLSSPEHMKFYVIVAEYDAPPFREQTEKFHKKLKESGFQSTYRLLKGDDHFTVIERLVDEEYDLTQLILSAIE